MFQLLSISWLPFGCNPVLVLAYFDGVWVEFISLLVGVYLSPINFIFVCISKHEHILHEVLAAVLALAELTAI